MGMSSERKPSNSGIVAQLVRKELTSLSDAAVESLVQTLTSKVERMDQDLERNIELMRNNSKILEELKGRQATIQSDMEALRRDSTEMKQMLKKLLERP